MTSSREPRTGAIEFDVDVSGISPGGQITVLFSGRPIFIRRRTADEIAQARATPLEDLQDDQSQNPNRPNTDASDENRTTPPFDGEDIGEWLIMVGLCTHMHCVPLGDGAGAFGGWFCPCHGSHFNISGRVRQGPAPTNMEIPGVEFIDATTIRLWETRAGFDDGF